MLDHLLDCYVQKHLNNDYATRLLWTGTTDVAVFIHLLLPITQKLELLIGPDLHKRFGQDETRIRRFIFGKPAIGLFLEFCDFRLCCTHIRSPFYVVLYGGTRASITSPCPREAPAMA